jgi:antitoxin ParD1/3/4
MSDVDKTSTLQYVLHIAREEHGMHVSLPPDLERFVDQQVHSGRYTSASEVVRDALRLLEEAQQDRLAQLTAFREDIDQRLASLDRGEGVDGATARTQLQQRSHAWRQEHP